MVAEKSFFFSFFFFRAARFNPIEIYVRYNIDVLADGVIYDQILLIATFRTRNKRRK